MKIYSYSQNTLWEIINSHGLLEQGIKFEINDKFINDLCLKTNVTKEGYSQLPDLIFDSWNNMQKYNNELSDVIINNTNLIDYELLNYLDELNCTDLEVIKLLKYHPDCLKGASIKIIDIYNKGEKLRKYCEKYGRKINFDA